MEKLGKGQAIMLVLQDKDEEAKEEYKSKYEDEEDMDREAEMCECPECGAKFFKEDMLKERDE